MKTNLVILDMGSTYADLVERIGDFSEWIYERVPEELKTSTAIVSHQDLPRYVRSHEISGIIITGSHDMVTDPDRDHALCFDTLQDLLEARPFLPVFGICYGHQLLAHLLGGKAAPKPEGPEIGLKEISFIVSDDEIFGGYSKKEVPFYCVHYQCAKEVPPGAKVFATSEQEEHHAFRIRNCWGVQFHPEFPKEADLYYERANSPIDGIEKRLLQIQEEYVENDLIARFCRFVAKPSED